MAGSRMIIIIFYTNRGSNEQIIKIQKSFAVTRHLNVTSSLAVKRLMLCRKIIKRILDLTVTMLRVTRLKRIIE